MIDKNLQFSRPARDARDLNLPADEPSHIHIARPSRVQRRDISVSNVGPTDQVRDLATTKVIVQAA